MRVTAPARIDLAGGTLDVPPLCFLIENALTINLAIDLTVSVELEPADTWRVFPNGRQGHDIPLAPLFQKTVGYLKLKRPFHIYITSNIPKASGLGGSSSLLVALVKAFLESGEADPREASLLELVTVLEHRLLGKPAGTQDAIAAIEGGLSSIEYASGKPVCSHVLLPPFLSGDLYLAYSSVQHHSGLNNWGIIKAACEGESGTLACLDALSENARILKDAILTQDEDAFLVALQHEAELRNQLATGLLTPAMGGLANDLPARTAAKICGAGGGGCMFLFGELPDYDELQAMATGHGLEILKVAWRKEGCREEGQ